MAVKVQWDQCGCAPIGQRVCSEGWRSDYTYETCIFDMGCTFVSGVYNLCLNWAIYGVSWLTW